jgi:hypothetical protein
MPLLQTFANASRRGYISAGPSVVPGSFELISTQTFGGDGASVTFSSIPQTYKHLKVIWSVRSVGTPSENASYVSVRMNGNTGQAYSGYPLVDANGNVQNTYQEGVNPQGDTFSSSLSSAPSSNTNSQDGFNQGYGELWIPNYTGTAFTRRTISTHGAIAPRSPSSYIVSDRFKSGAAISTLTFQVWSPGNNNFANYQSGSTFSLYGYLG